MNTVNVLNTIAMACAVTMSVGGGTTAYAADPEIVKIGLAGPMTGAQAQYGKDFQSGAILAVEEFNATQPKIGGKLTKFVLESEDDQADPKAGTIVAQKLVDDGIKGMLGHVNSGVSIPASAIYSQAGLPQISVSSAPSFTRQGFKTTFRSCTSDVQQGAAMGKYAVEVLKAKRIVVVDDRTAYGQGLAEQFLLAVQAAGGGILDHQFVSDKAIDFRAILTTIKSENPDLIYYAGSDPQSAPLFKQARGLAIKAQFASGDMSKTDSFISVAGPAAEGAVVSLPGLPLSTMPGSVGFKKNYKNKFGTDPATLAPYSFDGAMAMMQSMVKAGSSEPSIYLPVLARIDMKGVTNDHFSFDKYGDQREGLITIFKVRDGQFVPIQTLGSK